MSELRILALLHVVAVPAAAAPVARPRASHGVSTPFAGICRRVVYALRPGSALRLRGRLHFIVAFLALLPAIARASDFVNLSTACVNGLQVDINGGTSSTGVAYVEWNWGDGKSDAGFFPRSHNYASPGEFTVTVTAHYNDGSTASSHQPVNVAPGVLSNCNSLTITAGPNGSVYYQASVGSATIPAGQSATLELDAEDDLLLTAIPTPGYSFSSWPAYVGITGTGGSPINTTSPSIEIVVNSSGSITGAFSAGCTGSPSYQVDVSPTSQTVAPSGTTSFLLSLEPQNCFKGGVKFSYLLDPSLPPDSVSASPPAGTFIQPGVPLTFVISVGPTVPPGKYLAKDI